MSVTELTSKDFDAFVSSNNVVLIDCWAPWCGPCRRMGPEVDRVAEEMAGKVAVGKLNTDENQEIAYKYSINAIPTLLVFKNGEQQESLVGLRPAADVIEYLNGFLE